MVAGIVRNGNGNTPSEILKAGKAAYNQPSTTDKNSHHGTSNIQMTPERRFVVRHQISTSDSSICSASASTFNAKAQGPCVSGILDSFTSLCLGSPPADISVTSRNDRRQRQEQNNGSRKRVVYPVSGFNVHLNSEQLVDQRRKSLHDHQFFRPVSEDEMSRSVRPRTK